MIKQSAHNRQSVGLIPTAAINLKGSIMKDINHEEFDELMVKVLRISPATEVDGARDGLSSYLSGKEVSSVFYELPEWDKAKRPHLKRLRVNILRDEPNDVYHSLREIIDIDDADNADNQVYLREDGREYVETGVVICSSCICMN